MKDFKKAESMTQNSVNQHVVFPNYNYAFLSGRRGQLLVNCEGHPISPTNGIVLDLG